VSRAIEWILLGAGSCGALIFGVIRHRPARIVPWLLLAAALASLAVGDVFYALHDMPPADAAYLTMFVLVGAALLQFTRGGALLVDRARLIDLLAFTCAALLVVWVFVIGDKGQLGKISASDVIGGLILVGVAARLRWAAGRNLAATLLLLGSLTMLLSDIIYPLAPNPTTEAGYTILYLAWGLAALHPSMVRLTEPMPPRLTPWNGRWAALLGVSVAAPPVVLLIESLTGTVEDGVVIAMASAITLTLAITRLADSVNLSMQGLSRERALRSASASLVAAADLPAVVEAVRAAVRDLVPAQAISKVVFATDDRQLALESIPAVASGPHPRSWWANDDPDDTPPPEVAAWRRLLPWRVSTPDSAPPQTRSSNQGRDEQPRPTGRASASSGFFAILGRKHPVAATDQEGTLVCPLWLEPLAVARPSGGALVLTGRRTGLTLARDALEVLAGQAALALDRITLVDAVGRRDSDLYLRAVIRNTADLMLVIDEDRRIRYASPALHDLLGADDLSPLSTLEDLVHDDDRAQIRTAFAAEGDGTLFFALRRADHSQALVEATYRDLRDDRLVQGFVVTMRNVTAAHDPVEQLPQLSHVDELPAWVNRRSAQHKFRY
jgi:PAS domain S-box-containing protein